MPVYEFECKKCQARFEKLCGMSAGTDGITCPKCESTEIKRLISSFYSKSSSGSGHSSSHDCGGCHKSSCAGCH